MNLGLASQVLEGRPEDGKTGSKSEHLLSVFAGEGRKRTDLKRKRLLNYLQFCLRRFHLEGNSSLNRRLGLKGLKILLGYERDLLVDLDLDITW